MSKKHFIAIEDGVSPCQVLQRGADDHVDIRFAGSTTVPNGTEVEARLLRFGQAMSCFPWSGVGLVEGGAFDGLVSGVPAGGPYALEVRAVEKEAVLAAGACAGILVGDLWVLAGQSNMEGCGRLDAPEVEEPTPLVHAFDMSDRWLIACEPLHWRVDSVDAAHWPGPRKPTEEEALLYHRDRPTGVGPGLAFAREIVRHTAVPIGLVPCAIGGTSMDQWSPARVKLGGKSLYGAMLRRFGAVGSHVKGVLWYQGESDAAPGLVDNYATKFSQFVRGLRRDFEQPDLPVLSVQIGRIFVPHPTHLDWNGVQETQRKCAEKMRNTDMVPAVDLTMDDHVHVSTAGQKRLGERLAVVALRRVYGWGNLKVGPRLESVELKRDDTVRVRYQEVNSRLLPLGEVSGFSVRDAKARDLSLIYKAQVDPDALDTVVLSLKEHVPAGAFLWYGFGPAPFCNLTDELDMGAPVFGPRLLRKEDRSAASGIHASRAE